MKTIFSYLLSAFIAIAFFSCSESENLLSVEENVETRAGSPLLIASPTEVYFTDVNVETRVRDTVNVKVAGLPLLATLTDFEVIIQGPDAFQFGWTDPELGLVEFLQALLGGGVDIPVSYRPYTHGSHEAELLVTASLLGIVAPVQITVPLHGNTTALPIPQLVSTVPVNGGTVNFDGPVEGSDKGEYHVDFIFDQDIVIYNSIFIHLKNITSANIAGIQVINGNTLRVTIWEIPGVTVPNAVVLEENAIISAQATDGDRASGFVQGNTKIQLDYQAIGDIPGN